MNTDIAEQAYGLLWKDRNNEARRLLCDAIGKDGQRRGILFALDTVPFVGKEQVSVTAIWLKNIGDYVIVEAEIGGVWVEVVRERFDGAYSHIAEAGGIRKAYLNSLMDAVLAKAEGR